MPFTVTPDYTGHITSETVSHAGDTTAKLWDFSQGGNDVLTGGAGNDTFFMGSEYWSSFTPSDTIAANDTINGGAGRNTLELAGDYYDHAHDKSGTRYAATLVFGPNVLVNVDTIKLDQGVGFGYHLRFDATTFAAFLYGTIDASALTSAPLIVDGSASTSPLNITTGTGAYDLTGTASFDRFLLMNGFAAGDRVDGGAGSDTVYLDTIYGGSTLTLPDAAFANIEDFTLVGERAYIVTVGDGQTPAGGTLEVSLVSFDSDDGSSDGTLHFDGSAELDGKLQVSGGNGDDVLIGGAGNDRLSGGAGDGSDHLEGGAGNDSLYANGSGSQSLSGGDGNDYLSANVDSTVVMDGGAGDDAIVAYLGSTGTVRIDGGAGTDHVELALPADHPVTVDASVLQNVEVLTLAYSAAMASQVRSVIWGDGILAAGQVLPVDTYYGVHFDFDGSAETHGSFVFTLTGGDNGGDHWSGGSGDDVFIAQDITPGDVWDGGGGIDTLDYSAIWELVWIDAEAGDVTVAGTPGDSFADFEIYVFGAGDNGFNGAASGETVRMLQAGEETVHANGGDDTILLGATFDKFDLIDGGLGNDTVVLDGDYAGLVLNAATLTGVETLRLTGGHSYALTTNDANVAAGQTLTVDGTALGARDVLTFNGSAETNGSLAVAGGAGNDVIEGGRGNDVLDGGAGIDTASFAHAIAGVTARIGLGSAQNTVGAGSDKLLNFENLIGSAFADTLAGNSGVNHLDGGAGADTMQGGKGDDFYVVDNIGDKVIEADGDGSDTIDSSVTYSLAGQYVEVLNLTGHDAINGTGNSLANRIVGNDAANILVGGDGSDRLDGGAGADTMKGGLGNDVYVVDNALDKIVENDGEGTDTVEASFSYSIAGQYIEILKLMGSGDFTATGNGLANTLYGNTGNNTLNGGTGADTLYGGAGNDLYIVDNAGDRVFENNGEGIDTVQSSVSFSINGQYVENLSLTGSAAINATGNSLANVLTGNSASNVLSGGGGDDTLHGGLGSDTLTGGAGADGYWFETAPGSGNVDTITDFSAADDTIFLDRTIFAGIAANGVLDAAAFWQGTAAHDADDRIVYDQASGNLWYDADGSGTGTAVLFAHVAAGTALTAADFFGVP